MNSVVESRIIASIADTITKDEQLPESGDVTDDDSLSVEEKDEGKDLLDIPAFLRRQAN